MDSTIFGWPTAGRNELSWLAWAENSQLASSHPKLIHSLSAASVRKSRIAKTRFNIVLFGCAGLEEKLRVNKMEVAFQPSSSHPSDGTRSKVSDDGSLLTTNEQLSEFQDIIQRMDRILNEPVVTAASSYSGYCNTYTCSDNLTSRGTHLLVGNGCTPNHQHCRSAPATCTVAVDLFPRVPETRTPVVDSHIVGKEIPATVRVNIGIDEDLKMILDMDPSIIDVVATDSQRQQQQVPPPSPPLPPPLPPPPDKVVGLPPRAGGYDLVMSCPCSCVSVSLENKILNRKSEVIMAGWSG